MAATSNKGSLWVPLYNGREAYLSKTDRERLLTILDAYGIDHEVDSSDGKIFVPRENQNKIQTMIAKIYQAHGNLPHTTND